MSEQPALPPQPQCVVAARPSHSLTRLSGCSVRAPTGEGHAILAVEVIRRSWQSPLIVLLVREAVQPIATSATAAAAAAAAADRAGSGGGSNAAGAFGSAGTARGAGLVSPSSASTLAGHGASGGNAGGSMRGHGNGNGSRAGAGGASAAATATAATAAETIASYGLHVFGFGCPSDASLQVLCRHQLFVQLDYREFCLAYSLLITHYAYCIPYRPRPCLPFPFPFRNALT